MAEKTESEILAETIKEIEKQYGKGSIMRLGDTAKVDVDAISSGSLLIDQALGVGGYPRGRIVEIYGPESSGKTTLALHAIAEVQKAGGRAAFIDAENAIDSMYARNLGVQIDDLILSQPDSGEQALEIAEMLIKSGAIDLLVVDSVAALVPQAELDGVMGDSSIGLQARLMSKAMRKLAGVMNKSKCTVIFINQL
ncbi:MAG: AAA family ATPase, partial [Erysipelotrichaceae bacterium]|nr:AAA family ATPase [Erysipelotrichaceae bacterium]